MIESFFKNRKVDLEKTRVFVYYNPTKQSFIVKALEGSHKGKIILQSSFLTLKGALFVTKGLEESRPCCRVGVAGYITSNKKDSSLVNSLNPVEFNKEEKEFVMKEAFKRVAHYSPTVYLEESKFYCK